MRMTEFDRLVTDEFGRLQGTWMLDSHVLLSLNMTAAQALEAGIDPSGVWRAICEEFRIPIEREFGNDL
ncbi:DUF3046 domain-containing protein [Corynebacterium sp. HS2168-gen11]|nr:DUF3046 domain-containing protein [Corynebacterium sp. HS2168-gen11]MCS4536349.1 DUF3046 domain-containing protein [Corynebacterium sp. HS2168-gen11]